MGGFCLGERRKNHSVLCTMHYALCIKKAPFRVLLKIILRSLPEFLQEQFLPQQVLQ